MMIFCTVRGGTKLVPRQKENLNLALEHSQLGI